MHTSEITNLSRAINGSLIAGEFLFMLNWHHIDGILNDWKAIELD